jgi:hypothetical protein
MNINEFFNTNSDGFVTGYGLITGTNKILSELGDTKILPTPMGYTYLKNGYVTGTKNVKFCTIDEAVAWSIKYVTKRGFQIVTESPVNEIQNTLDEFNTVSE